MARSAPLPARKALTLALGAALGTLLPLAAPAQSATTEYDDEEMVLEEVIVTGTRIERTLNTLSQPVVSFTAEDMVASGDISVAEALRNSTLNSFGSLAELALGQFQSNATLDLRGLGPGYNLVLLNGRRTVGSPALLGGGAVNLNMIPYAAVDRIEIVADGASAVYGSDAIAGVTNVILKKNYEGLLFQARYGDRSEDDGTEESASVVLGAGNGRASLTFALEYDKRDPIYDADREYTRPRWGDYDGDGEIVGFEESVGVSWFGYTLLNPDWYPGLPYDANDPNTWFVTPGAGCPEGDGWAGVMSGDAVFGPESGYYCGYAFGMVAARRAGLERLNSWVGADYQLTDAVELYADVIISQIESFGRWAPPAANGPPIPGDPRNDIGATFGWYRFTEVGFRDQVINDTLTDINLGARGEFGNGVSWEAYYTWSDYVAVATGNYFLSWAGLAYNYQYGIDDFDTFVANMRATTVDDYRQNLQKLFGGLQFDLFEAPAGTVTAYVGAEYFEIDYAALVDAQSNTLWLVGGRGFNANPSMSGYRDVTAVFAEAVAPLFDWWEVDLALRYDDYSDFGSSTTPRIGTVLHVPGYEDVRFKASWGRGFHAPELADLYGPDIDSIMYTGGDYYGCQLNGIAEDECWQFAYEIEVSSGANPELQAETSESWSLGAEWQFADRWLAGVNYFYLELDDRIVYWAARDHLNADYYSGGNNPYVQRNAQGWAVQIDARALNSYVPLSYDGVDFSLSGGAATRAGNFGLQGQLSWFLSHEQELTAYTGETFDASGYLGFPEWRGSLLLTWELGDAFASLNCDYAAEQENRVTGDRTDPWYTFNLQAGYDFGRFGTVTLGANNLLNRGASVDASGAPYEAWAFIEDFTGRVLFLSYRLER
jgi:iron complex outermembrane receptor protein